jgi:CDP-glycerol glycerophosphotransferase (TagB/SpsB family)
MIRIRKLPEKLWKKVDFYSHYLANHFFKKSNRVLICEPSIIDANCIEVANFLVANYKMPVALGLPKELMGFAKMMVSPQVEVLDKDTMRFKLLYFKSKYIFAAYGTFPRFFTRDQRVLNIWHGLPLKKIGLMRGARGIPAHFTLATSELTKKTFVAAFGVSPESIIISGYPRNDLLLRESADKVGLKCRLEGNLCGFDKIIIWLPTFRRDTVTAHGINGLPVDNAFQIEGFDVGGFNDLLLKYNVCCLVKPHPLEVKRIDDHAHSNIRIISDEWIFRQGITLYHLAACSDILVSDISSIILDYLVLDQPVLCFSTDFDEYKAGRGYVYDDLENWLPGKLLRNQDEFTLYLEGILKTGLDPWEVKRKKLKDDFFAYHDAESTKRLLEQVFNASK